MFRRLIIHLRNGLLRPHVVGRRLEFSGESALGSAPTQRHDPLPFAFNLPEGVVRVFSLAPFEEFKIISGIIRDERERRVRRDITVPLHARNEIRWIPSQLFSRYIYLYRGQEEGDGGL